MATGRGKAKEDNIGPQRSGLPEFLQAAERAPIFFTKKKKIASDEKIATPAIVAGRTKTRRQREIKVSLSLQKESIRSFHAEYFQPRSMQPH
jgi:hypothetical protein